MNWEDNFENLEKHFEQAATHVRSLVSSLSEEQMLQFYGLYKQAKEGPCNKPKPNWFKLTEKQKWEAWSSLGNQDSNTSKKKYIALLTDLDASWEEKNVKEIGAWTHHSCFQVNEEEISDSKKTIFDWVKENNFSQVENVTKDANFKINILDEEGLSPLHWAADRGHLDITKYFIQKLQADINIQDADGQTPLHYAASCGHKEVVEYLIESGADVNIVDNDQQKPLDVSSNSQIEDLLKKVQST